MRRNPTCEELALVTLNKAQIGQPTLPYVPPNNVEHVLMQLQGLSEDIKLRELSARNINIDANQIATATGMPADAVQRLIGASEANVAASGALQAQMQTFQQASVRGQQLQTEALLRQLGGPRRLNLSKTFYCNRCKRL